MQEPRPVTVAILNWNSRDMLARCIDSVQQQSYPAVELKILDNASTDGSVEFVRAAYPELPLTAFQENLGFGRAHNRAIRASKAAYYMPLNPDVVLEPGFVSELVTALEQDDRHGAASGKLLFMDEDGTRTDLLYTTGHLLTKSRSPTNRGYKRQDVGQYQESESIFCANGAAPLYRRSMLEDVALDGAYFNEDFFIYGDDHDLGWRAQLAGWRCVYSPRAVGHHVGFGSGGMRRFSVQVQFTRNRYLTLVRNDRITDFCLDLPYVLAYELIWQASQLVRSPKRLVAHWWGLAQASFSLSRALAARKTIQRQRRVSARYIRSLFVPQLW